MENFYSKFVDYLRLRADGLKTIRAHIREAIFAHADRLGIDETTLMIELEATSEEIQAYREGRKNLTSMQVSALASFDWRRPLSLNLDVVPIRRLSKRDIANWEDYASRDGTRIIPETTLEEAACACRKPKKEKPCWEYDPSQSFQSNPGYLDEALRKDRDSRAPTHVIEGVIAIHLLHYLDTHPECDF